MRRRHLSDPVVHELPAQPGMLPVTKNVVGIRLEPRQYTLTLTLVCGHTTEKIIAASALSKGKTWATAICPDCSTIIPGGTFQEKP